MGARAFFDGIPKALALAAPGKGCYARVYARFSDGRLLTPVRLAIVRVPPAAIEELNVSTAIVDPGELEAAARQFGLDKGQTELVIEYSSEGDWHLHWVDCSWAVAVADVQAHAPAADAA